MPENTKRIKKTNGFVANPLIKKDQGKVLLVTSITGIGFNIAPHFGMYQIYNYVHHHNIDCDMYDRDLELFNKTELDEKEVLKRIKKGEYDIIGISVSQDKSQNSGEQTMFADLDLICKMKLAAESSGKMPAFVAGGQAATLNYKLWLDLGIDLIVLGYGEKTFYDICKRYFAIQNTSRNVPELINVAETIRGVSYKDKKGIYRYTPALPVDKKLFYELFYEFPQKYDLPHKTFWDIVAEKHANKDLGASEFIIENVRLYTTSHCPRHCGFCNSGQFLPEMSASEDDLMLNKKGVRSSSGRQKLIQLNAKELIDLVMFNIKKYGAKSILFSDDDFALKSKHNRVQEFCKMVIDYKQRGLIDKNVVFNCQTHITDWLTANKEPNEELIRDVAAAGFKSISVGVETFTDRIISSVSINKIGFKSIHARAVLDTMLASGIVPQTNVILGVPEYTVDDLLHTVDVALEYVVKGCDLALNRQLLAYPGAPIYESGKYKVVYQKWTHPVSGKVVTIPEYFVPNDPVVAKAMDVFDAEAQKELDKVIKKMNWGKKHPPKRVINIAALCCLPRLLNRDELTPKYYKILDDVLAGKLRQNAEISYPLDIQGVHRQFSKEKNIDKRLQN